ncbi:lipoprotein required for motility, partial [Campylobacter coli]|nr:lipoprotein required for motility [Campylobacter coli]
MKKFYFMLIIAGIFAGCTASTNSTTAKNPNSPSTSAQASDIVVQK